MTFGRSFDEPVIVPLHGAATSSALIALMDEIGSETRIAVSDLTFGPGRGFQIVAEICGQLGLVASIPTMLGGGAVAGGGSELAPWIDGEWKGDFCALNAFDLARRIVQDLEDQAATAIMVLAPRGGHDWGEDNAQFIKFLALGFRDSAHRLIIVRAAREAPPALPAPIELMEVSGPEWHHVPVPTTTSPLAALPGLVPLGVVQRLVGEAVNVGLLSLDGGLALIAPEDRADVSQIPERAFADLVTACRDSPGDADWSWCRGFALAYGRVDRDVATELRAIAWQLVGAGSFIAARRILEQALCRAEGVVAAEIQADMLRMVIAAQRYDVAADTPDPMVGLPTDISRGIHDGKGWGYVMSGRAPDALRHFTALRAPEPADADAHDIIGLYLLNIFALVKSRMGDSAGALDLERAVEAAATRGGSEVWHLRYINAVNIARLMRLSGDLAEAERYFWKAFGEIDGLRGESVQIYANLVMGRIKAAQGNAEAARQSLLRACLHWLAMPVPEALGWRTARTVIGEPAHMRDDESAIRTGRALPLEVVARISQALLEALVVACARTGRPIPDVSRVTACFVGQAADHIPYFSDHAITVHAAPGWTAVDCEIADSAPLGSLDNASRRLRCVVHAVLIEDGNGDSFASGCVLIDPRYGREIALNDGEILETAWRWRASRIAIGARSHPVDADMLDAAIRHARMGPSRAVAGIELRGDVAFVTFRRLRPPLRLTTGQSAVVDLLSRNDSVGDHIASLRRRLATADVVDLIRSLDSEGLLTWDFSEAARHLGFNSGIAA